MEATTTVETTAASSMEATTTKPMEAAAAICVHCRATVESGSTTVPMETGLTVESPIRAAISNTVQHPRVPISTTVAETVVKATDARLWSAPSSTIAVAVVEPIGISACITITISTAITPAAMTPVRMRPAPATPWMAPSPTPWRSVPPGKPRASTNKETAHKPVWAIVPIRSAVIRPVRVISPGADRWRCHIHRGRIVHHRPNTDTNSDLAMGERSRQSKRREQRE